MRKALKFVVYLCALFAITCITYYYNYDFIVANYINYQRVVQSKEAFILFTDGCKIPKYNPFDDTIINYYKNTTGDIPCKGKRYMNVVNNSIIIDENAVLQDYPNKSFTCTYNPILRNPKNLTQRADNKFEYGPSKKLIFGTHITDEFIKVYCNVSGKNVYEDFFATTPLKYKKELSMNNTSEKLNIIVIGIDSISKLNFERHFPLTKKFIQQNLHAFEFHGYMKVADNTFPNLTPMLTGHFVEYYYTSENKQRYFDDLEFIWKNFSSIGYTTLLAEDAPDMATYNYLKNGFRFPPTDYFLRPFTLAIEDSPWQKASKKDCFQAKPEIVVLFDYLRSFLETMGNNRRYFAFTWAARLTHGDVNKAGYADKPTYELLSDIHKMGLMNNSMIIFMSDHGIRFGGIRKTYIGKIEERMPFLFISFPSWFLDAHPNMTRNMKINEKRLVTPFDLHETLADIYHMMSGNTSGYVPTPYGISLFKEIPLTRSCENAFILPHWCPCHHYSRLPRWDARVTKAAHAVIKALNNMTESRREVCSILELKQVYDARILQPQKKVLRYNKLRHEGDESSAIYEKEAESHPHLVVTLQTTPNYADFESTVVLKNVYQVLDISRISVYGTQGDCISDFNLRKYCYCKTKIF